MGTTDHRKTNILHKKRCFYFEKSNIHFKLLTQKKMAGNSQIHPQGEKIRSDNLSLLFGWPSLMVENDCYSLEKNAHVFTRAR